MERGSDLTDLIIQLHLPKPQVPVETNVRDDAVGYQEMATALT